MLPRRTYTYESRRYKTTFRHSENTNKKKGNTNIQGIQI